MNPTKTNTPTKTELSQLCNQTKTRNREKFDFRPILNGAAYFRRHLLENDETVILDIFTWPVIHSIFVIMKTYCNIEKVHLHLH